MERKTLGGSKMRIYNLIFLGLIFILTLSSLSSSLDPKIQKILNSLKWYGHASIMVKTEKIIYFDPFELPAGVEKADIILITHEHYDHFSPDDIKKIQKEDTVIVSPPDVIAKVKGEKREILPGKEVEIHGIKIKAVPAYNINKRFHPKEKNWVGYIVEIEGVRIYHAGDTDFIPEMKNLGKIDIAFLPVGGTYTMDAKEAAQAANTISPSVAIPMHWGSIVGSQKDAESFKKECKVNVMILPKEK
jgi:L-ascorbate metabolism protein UlaG (beta-lactamase superfamily)